MTVLRSLAMLLAAILVVGCGSVAHPTNQVAVIAGQPITVVQYQQYLAYALRFYQAAGTAVPTQKACRLGTPPCATFRRQVLRRMLEERVVLQYARYRHIVLTPLDQRRIGAQLTVLTGAGSAASALLGDKSIGRSFFQTVLEDEALVRKVELAVTRYRADQGPSYHLQIIAIPRTSGGSGAAAYGEAVTLATDGHPIPADAALRTEWVAPFRLGSDVRAAVTVAQPGDFLGPFTQGNHFLVVHYLTSGIHHYGRSARLVMQAKVFGSWLARHVSQAHPQCFGNDGKTQPCPARID